MDKPTLKQIAKLAKWAQTYIESLERERDEANRLLTKFTDSQTESPFSYQEFRGTDPDGATRYPVRYIQTHKIGVTHEGLQVEILLPRGVQGRTGVEINLSADPGFVAGIFPSASNCIAVRAFKRE